MNEWNPERLRKVIEAKGLTRRHIAKVALLSEASLTKIMNGRKPSKRLLTLIALALDTNPEYLSYESDDPGAKRSA